MSSVRWQQKINQNDVVGLLSFADEIHREVSQMRHLIGGVSDQKRNFFKEVQEQINNSDCLKALFSNGDDSFKLRSACCYGHACAKPTVMDFINLCVDPVHHSNIQILLEKKSIGNDIDHQLTSCLALRGLFSTRT